MIEFADIQKKFTSELKADAQMGKIYKTIMDGGGNYRTASRYADRLGKIWSDVLTDTLGDEIVSEELANTLVFPALASDYEMAAEMAGAVQKGLNKRAGIGLKPKVPDLDREHINEIIGRLTESEDVNMISADVLQQLAKSAINDTIEENAKFQSESGLKSYISRSSGGGCCEWCEEVSGVYEYGEEPDGFYRQHNNCTCVITFMPSKQSWERITYGTNSSGQRTQTRTTL